MNQILITKKYKRLFIIQLIASLIIIGLILIVYFSYNIYIKKKEEISKQLINNYNISQLYANNSNESISNSINTHKEEDNKFTVIGVIEIPKLNISYPILSEVSDELLKIAPCRLSGPMPNEEGNLCIAGHNYENYKFFSKVPTLEASDEVIIYDLNGNKEIYLVYDKYEVNIQDLSPLEESLGIKKQITLITCNNKNENRIIVKAKIKI